MPQTPALISISDGNETFEKFLRWDSVYAGIPQSDYEKVILDAFAFHDLVATFALPGAALRDFVAGIARGYAANPYHNWSHAFSTFHMSFLELTDLAMYLVASNDVDGLQNTPSTDLTRSATGDLHRSVTGLSPPDTGEEVAESGRRPGAAAS